MNGRTQCAPTPQKSPNGLFFIEICFYMCYNVQKKKRGLIFMELKFFLPLLIPLLIYVLVAFLVIRFFRKKSKKKTTMQDFVKNPFGNIFNVALGSIEQSSRLDTAFQSVISNPCEQTAVHLLNELNSVDDIFKFGMSNGSGINTALWKNTFNNYIVDNKNIRIETQQQIREALIRLSVDHLRQIVDTKAIGDAGEANVWFMLSRLAANGKLNAFSSVRLHYKKANNERHSQEIDNIIVCPKGVFLLEVKTKLPAEGRAVSFQEIPSPYTQIVEHEEAFIYNFEHIPYQNLLVLSYPRDRYVAYDVSTFPQNDKYTVLTVDNLVEYLATMEGPDVLDSETIDAISTKLKSEKNWNYVDGKPVTKWFVDKCERTAFKEQTEQAVVCSQCGKELISATPFCPHCGAKL